MHSFTTLAQTTETSGGIAALGLNVKYFVFQLVSFVIVLLVLRKWVFPRLIATLEDRRKVVEQSLERAKATESAVRDAKEQIHGLLEEARVEARSMLELAHKESIAFMHEAEAKARQQADYVVKEAEAQVRAEAMAASEQLKKETVQRVVQAVEYILKQKVDPAKNAGLIQAALAQVSKEKQT